MRDLWTFCHHVPSDGGYWYWYQNGRELHLSHSKLLSDFYNVFSRVLMDNSKFFSAENSMFSLRLCLILLNTLSIQIFVTNKVVLLVLTYLFSTFWPWPICQPESIWFRGFHTHGTLFYLQALFVMIKRLEYVHQSL